MQIERQQSLSMVDHDAIPFKEQRPRQNHASAIYGCDRGPTRHTKIEPLMRALNRSVEDAFDAEHIRDCGLHRGSERTSPFTFRANRLEYIGFHFLALLNLALVFRAGLGIARGNLQRHAGVALMVHSNFFFERDRLVDRSLGSFYGEVFGVKFQGINARLGFKADSSQREPRLMTRVQTESNLVPQPTPRKRANRGWCRNQKQYRGS